MPKKLMKITIAVFRWLAVVLGLGRITGQAESAYTAPQKQQPSGLSAKNKMTVLPPLPAGVTELKFNEFFVNPVGDRGFVVSNPEFPLPQSEIARFGRFGTPDSF